MDNRAFLSGASATAPTALGSPSVGYPTGGNPATATPATDPGPFWFHAWGEELRSVIVAGGLTPTQGTLTQVRDALDARYGFVASGQQSLASRGYQKLPGGLIVQWGRETNSPGLTSIVFPLAFPTECFVVMLTQRNSIGGSTNNIGATNYSKTGFDLYASTNEVPNSWFAVGY